MVEQEIREISITASMEDIPLPARASHEPWRGLRGRLEGGPGEGRGKQVGEGQSGWPGLEPVGDCSDRKFSGEAPAGLAKYLAELPPEAGDEILDKRVTALSVSDALGHDAPKGGIIAVVSVPYGFPASGAAMSPNREQLLAVKLFWQRVELFRLRPTSTRSEKSRIERCPAPAPQAPAVGPECVLAGHPRVRLVSIPAAMP
jgi:hypothetical protein